MQCMYLENRQCILCLFDVNNLMQCMYLENRQCILCLFDVNNLMQCMCNELGGNMARSTQFPIMITRSTIIYEIVSPDAAGSSIYI